LMLHGMTGYKLLSPCKFEVFIVVLLKILGVWDVMLSPLVSSS
jgi:hypothetical protein